MARIEEVGDSILDTAKSMIDIEPDVEDFDVALVAYTNIAFMILGQIGVGPENGYIIKDRTATWQEYKDTTGAEDTFVDVLKGYIAIKVKQLFDAPTSGALKEVLTDQIAELEWRLSVLWRSKDGTND